ncbi:FUN14 domain-containing protein 1-like [Ischnura elegans]|uniref:FUN14 domain-containing protein 1-like n=1 Tax=Ischnura elegans TaxID=197161 RepID=UPI001ED88C84|nr:FUN14 domain-containing protein 1-like [Ischnura elegans]XP_046383499.1 FUN14 domain-containing protein 1-like [Ischnura elegans]XP_046383500.1 FUN14 domain-containing protein 1-like [Ischnura elegans]
MASALGNKSKGKEENNQELVSVDEMAKKTKGVIEKILGDVSKTSATKQIALGGVSGWCTGFLAMKVGKVAAMAVGGGIILLQVANHQGYIHINWDKIYRKVDKVVDKMEEKATGEKQPWVNKAERYLDRKLDRAEALLKDKERKARRKWYNFFGGEEPFETREIHVFVVSYVAGLALGLGTGM